MIIYYGILIIMTMLGAIASLFLKKASGAENLVQMIKNVNLYIGGMLYLSSAILNIWILKILDYSVVLPLTSFTYSFLREHITKKKIFGVMLILIGAVLVSLDKI